VKTMSGLQSRRGPWLMGRGRPAYRELDLRDVEAFRASVSEETLSALREPHLPLTHFR